MLVVFCDMLLLILLIWGAKIFLQGEKLLVVSVRTFGPQTRVLYIVGTFHRHNNNFYAQTAYCIYYITCCIHGHHILGETFVKCVYFLYGIKIIYNYSDHFIIKNMHIHI